MSAAVAAFLDKRIRFDQIHWVNQATLETVPVCGVNDVESLLALDAQARATASRIAENLEC